MVAVKTTEVERFIAKPPETGVSYLVYGPDAGLVSERAQALARSFSDPNDPFSLIRLEGAMLAANPGRLAEEAYAVAMFGGRRVILLSDANARASLTEAIAALLQDPPKDTILIIEAGDLKKSHALRGLFEKAKHAYAIACYADDRRTLGALIDQEIAAHDLAIDPAARALLIASLGNDRLVSRGEVQKLCLHALHTGKITTEDVLALTADSAVLMLDDIVDAVAAGDVPQLLTGLARAARERVEASRIAAQVLRHFQMLDLLRGALEAGRPLRDTMESLQPPLFFRRREKVEAALHLWPPRFLARALLRLHETVRDTRLSPALAYAILSDSLLLLARSVNPRGGNQ